MRRDVTGRRMFCE